MAGDSSAKTSGGPNPMDKLTDDLLIEIFSRAPYRSLRRFTCVSGRWRDLIANPDHRRKLPQTLAGFFYHAPNRGFADVSGTDLPIFDPSLAFLPDRERKRLLLMDGCNGLLLCRCFRFPDPNELDYLVINPATEKWVAVPVSRLWSNKVDRVRLGFDPAVSSHFHVFEFQLDWVEDANGYTDEDDDKDGHVLGVAIYSSENRAWRHKQSGWSDELVLTDDFKSAFVNGMLYVADAAFQIGMVDVEGKTWRLIDFPSSDDLPFLDTAPGYIDVSQGQLHFATSDDITGDKLAIWVLKDPESEEWTLKHMVSFNHLVRKQYVQFGYHEYIVVAVHPDRNIVFFVFGDDKTLMSYDMDSGKVHIICNLGRNYNEEYFISYVPLFSVALADGQQ